MGLFGPSGTRVIVKGHSGLGTTRTTLYSLDIELEQFLSICTKWDERVHAYSRGQARLADDRKMQGVTHEGAHVTDREAQSFASGATRERLNFIADVRTWINKEEADIKKTL